MKPEVYHKVQFALSKKTQERKKFNMLFVDHQMCHEFEPSTTKDPPCRGERCTLNLSRAQTSSCWSGVVVKRGQLKYRRRHLTMVQNYTRSVSKSPRVAEQCNVNIHSFDHESLLKL
ncbi:hypothetical protein TNCV_544941 [Trichonephila clavipes]|nr:hypothetical protein TNCV_544941 [Trichonephila clavipes]